METTLRKIPINRPAQLGPAPNDKIRIIGISGANVVITTDGSYVTDSGGNLVEI